MENYQPFFDDNKTSWNKRTAIHKDSAFYDLAGFKKGKSSLNKIEVAELGDVNGKSLLHLQCHFGMDTMSWAREGAKVTGVDFSDEAISLAKELAAELNIPADFICANVYDLPGTLKAAPLNITGHSEGYERNARVAFDIVFTSYGTIGWLPDLDAWAGIISHFLKPGGTFYIVDFHPALWMMDENFEKIKYDYFNTVTITEEVSGTYSNRDAPIKSVEHGWNHSLSEIISALLKHGLQVSGFNEFPYSPYNCFNNLEQGTDGMWRIKGMNEKMPMLYSIKAIKQI